jgi:uncharacterized protein (TIGR02598 family)
MMQRRNAFTLVESLLAISIASTVLLTLLALLPAGLDASREAARCTAEARILDRLRQQCAAAALAGDFYFDALGRPLSSRSADAALAVRVAPAVAVALPGDGTTILRSIRITLSDRMLNDPFADLTRLRVQQVLLAPVTNGGAP